jgi:hypothetical protein
MVQKLLLETRSHTHIYIHTDVSWAYLSLDKYLGQVKEASLDIIKIFFRDSRIHFHHERLSARFGI